MLKDSLVWDWPCEYGEKSSWVWIFIFSAYMQWWWWLLWRRSKIWIIFRLWWWWDAGHCHCHHRDIFDGGSLLRRKDGAPHLVRFPNSVGLHKRVGEADYSTPHLVRFPNHYCQVSWGTWLLYTSPHPEVHPILSKPSRCYIHLRWCFITISSWMFRVVRVPETPVLNHS